MQQESPRQCKICGGPNHYGCGCEARQKQAAVQVETESIKPEQPASEAPLKPDEVAMAKDIKTRVEIMSEGFETLCLSLYDTNNMLKIMAGDLITIRKHLTKEDEVKKDASENKN